MRDPEELSREELIAVVRDQAVRLSDQSARLAEQAVELKRLRAELEQIKRLISRNSGNSSMPPSSDDAPGKGRPSGQAGRKGGTGRKRGKQPGAAGSYLPWLGEADVRVVDRLPQGSCECGADLAGAADLGVERACQVTDVPLVTASTTEFRMHRVGCGCGRTHVAAPPSAAGVANTRVYGVNLRALVVYLLIVQHLPVGRCVRLVADLVGAGVSVGFAHKMLGYAAAVGRCGQGQEVRVGGLHRPVHPLRVGHPQWPAVPRAGDRVGVRRCGGARPVRGL